MVSFKGVGTFGILKGVLYFGILKGVLYFGILYGVLYFDILKGVGSFGILNSKVILCSQRRSDMDDLCRPLCIIASQLLVQRV